MEDNAAKVGDLIDRIIDERAEGNPAIVEMTKAKTDLKGINLIDTTTIHSISIQICWRS